VRLSSFEVFPDASVTVTSWVMDDAVPNVTHPMRVITPVVVPLMVALAEGMGTSTTTEVAC
jgi:hypothetical protein